MQTRDIPETIGAGERAEGEYCSKPANYFKHARVEIAKLLPETPVERCLEIGCGEGVTLEWLKHCGVCRWTAGAEIYPPAVESARKRVDVCFNVDIEIETLPLEPESLDLILCLDVLEHMRDPWRVITTLHQLLKPGGVLIASIPNVRHISVVGPLVFRGKWEYTQWGLLDRTHLRFFTRSTAIKLVECSGLCVEKHKVFRGRLWEICHWMTLGLGRPFFDFQYLIRARRPDIAHIDSQPGK